MASAYSTESLEQSEGLGILKTSASTCRNDSLPKESVPDMLNRKHFADLGEILASDHWKEHRTFAMKDPVVQTIHRPSLRAAGNAFQLQS